MQLPSSPVESRTFVELLRARAEQHGDRRACTFLSDGESSESVLTYRELDLRARHIGSWLQAQGSAGKPVLLVYPQGLDFIAAFFGCLYAGAIAIPAYPPRRNRRATRICCMVSDAHVEIALTTSELLEQIEGMLRDDPVLAQPRWQSTDQIDSPLAAAWTPPSSDPDSLAFLQYTSGSIGIPKGVMVSHANLLENQHLICHSFRQSENIVCVGWLPLHHDMGLIGNLLHPIYLGGHFVFMSPAVFLQQPIRWLRAISNYRATISGGPNFAFDMCVSGTTPQQREGLDLSALEVAFTGAERVQDRTLRDFESTFAPYGFSRDTFCPCYGLAETTLITSGIVKHEPVVTARLDPLTLAAGNVVPFDPSVARPSAAAEQTAVLTAKPIDLVSCGIPAPSIDIRIVDPETLTLCPAGRVGEIWVTGGTVAKGYWGKTDLTRETFLAPLADDPETQPPRHYLRTGDLGFMHDEHLYVAGRLKDLIIVRGGNHYPSDIEQTTGASHKSLIPGSCAAFSVDVDGHEQVVVVQEVQRSHLRSLDQTEVCEAIRQAIVEDHLVPLHAIILVRPGSVPKTTSGKIQRREARRMFEQDEYKVVARWDATDWPTVAAAREASSNGVDVSSNGVDVSPISPGHELLHLSAPQREALQALERWVLDRLSGYLGLPADSIDTHQPFARYGIDSLKAVRMTGELEEHLGRTIAPTLLYDYPNVATLVRYLVLGETRTATPGPQERPTDEPIAVIGVGCRFPGGQSPDAFWTLLENGCDAVASVPVGRWGEDLQRISEKSGSARHQVEWGGFLERVDQFDANLFGINAREAEEMDPQQRVLLHVAWEAVEDAGIPVNSLSGSLSGVFLGVSGNEYAHLQTACQHGPNIYRATGNSLAVIANRVSFLFDLQGPSWAVDTACSSSLVAVHQACVSLRRGECNLALAGGVSLIVSPDATSSLNQAGMLSPTGRCHTFSSQADGFVRGEGCGVLLLKRLSDAQAAGDRILCLLRGSAVNQDGRSNGLTAPNGLAQQAVLRSALAEAQLEPQEIDYVEAHGTGTALGDPIEMGALAAVFAPHRAVARPLRVGSVKTNIGHLEGAAGIAGLIKVCLALQHEALPPHLHFEQPSAHIDWSWPLEIPTALTPWRAEPARLRRAGVSSFGFGGTNAHVIVEQAPAPATPPPAETSVGGHPAQLPEPPALLLLSAKTSTALAAQARQFAQAARHHALPDVCYTAAVGRTHFPFRLALRAHDPQQVQQALEQFARHQPAPQLWHGQSQRQCRLAWVFGGQGPLLLGAGRALYEHHQTFRQLLDEALQCAVSYWNHDLRRVLWQDARLWQQVDIQPALFCLQVSLGRLWQHYGLQPSAVLGHSLGEYAAACLAGVFSLAEGLQLVTTRARLMRALETPGGMLVVRASQQQVRDLLAGGQPAVEIAAINGPRQTVVSGAAAAVRQFQDLLESHQIGHQRLATSHAFHCALVEPMLEEFAAVAQQVSYAPPQLPYFSGMLGNRVTHEVAQASYWQQHLRQPVRFYSALQGLMTDPPTAVLEVGAGSTACGLIRTAFRQADVCLLKGLAGNDREWIEHLQQLARLYTLGASLDWSAVWSRPGRKVSLPTYPFEAQRYWFRSAAAAERESTLPTAVQGQKVHPLLGRRLDLAGREVVYETQLQADSYLRDHRLGERIVLPATAYLELALAAGQDAGFQLLDVCQLKIRRPLELPPQARVRMQVVLTPRESGFDCRMRAQLAARWQTLASCHLEADPQPLPAGLPERELPLFEAGTASSGAEHYQRCRERGLNYGPAFQGLQRLTRGAGCARGEVVLPPDLTSDGYCLHPALLDACLQVTAGALHQHQAAAWLPVKVKRYQVELAAQRPTHLHVTARLNPTRDARTLDVTISAAGSTTGRPIFNIQQLTLRRVEGLRLSDTSTRHESPPATANSESMVPQLMRLSDEARRLHLLQHIRSRVAEILESDVNEVPIDRPLDTLGLDSLMAFELREEIKQSINIEVSLEVFLRDVTLSDLSNTLTDQLTARNNQEGERQAPTLLPSSFTAEEGLIEGAI